METTVLQGGAPDVIAYAFYQMGFRPRDSLIMVGLQGPRHRTGLVIRVDLPPRRQLPAVLRLQFDALRRAGEESLMVLVVADETASPGRSAGRSAGRSELPHQAMVSDLLRLARRDSWPVMDVIAVGEHHWRSYLCLDPGCCPTGGHPLSQVTSSAAAACMVAAGRVLAADESTLIADVEAADVEAAQVRAPEGDLNPLDAGEALRRWRLLLGRAADPDARHEMGWLGPALQDRWLRDAVLLTLVPGSGTAPEELLAGADDAVLEGMFDRRPDPELLERGRVLLSAVARVAPEGERVDALALLAWMSWWSGDGARGRLLATRALADRPGHRLARLVDGLLRLGVAPTWVTEELSAGRANRSDPGESQRLEHPDPEMGCPDA